MRRFDKKINIQKANLLSEQRYLESKGIIDEDWKTNLAAGLASVGGAVGASAQQPVSNPMNNITQTSQQSTPKTNVANPFNVSQSTNSNALLTINLSNSFESGDYQLNKNFQIDKLEKIKNYILNNPNNNYVIYITASESKVPNQKGFGVGKLAKKRSEILKKLITRHIPIKNVEIKSDAIVGGPEWDGKNKDDSKYTEHQFVKIEVYDAGVKPCSLETIKDKGSIAGKNVDFISNNIPITGIGSFEMTPGLIPDRLQLVKNGNVIFDTKYYANGNTYNNEWLYTPLHVAMLSELYVQNKNSPAFQNLGSDVVTFKSYEELVNYMLKDKKFNYKKDNRREVKQGLDKLKVLCDNGQTEFLFYTIKAPSIANVDADIKNPVDLITYSPLGSTGFGLKGMDCK